jgi:hypothetical protein
LISQYAIACAMAAQKEDETPSPRSLPDALAGCQGFDPALV